jgi:putative ABC transport system permease protein
MSSQGHTLKVVLDSLRCNKLRVCLAVFGVMIGSACIVLVVTVSLTGRRYVMEQIEAIGSNLVYANYEYDPSHPSALNDQINLADVEAVKSNIPEVAEAAGTREMPVTVQSNRNEIPANLIGVTERFQMIRKLVILQGRYFDQGETSSRNKVCLVTSTLAEHIAPGENPVGKSIRVGERRLEIIGVFAERVASSASDEIQRETVLVPFEQIKYLSGEDGESVWLLYAQARTPGDVPTVTRSLSRFLKNRHPGPAVYRVRNLDSVLDVADRVTFAVTLVMLIVALTAMVTSGVGIMNIMLTSVVERTPEIGVRRAFGARRIQILHQFLLEALAISLTGAAAGILLGLILPIILRPMLHDVMLRLQFTWVSPVLALLVSCMFGLFFGYLPANRAANIQPCEALRYE